MSDEDDEDDDHDKDDDHDHDIKVENNNFGNDYEDRSGRTRSSGEGEVNSRDHSSLEALAVGSLTFLNNGKGHVDEERKVSST